MFGNGMARGLSRARDQAHFAHPPRARLARGRVQAGFCAAIACSGFWLGSALSASGQEPYYITPAVLEAHRQLLRLSGHSVMAISRDGHIGGAYCDHGSDAPCGMYRLRELALRNCRQSGGRYCEVFAVADRVIVPYVVVEPEPDSGEPAALTGATVPPEPEAAPPELKDGGWSGETADWDAWVTLAGSSFEGRALCRRNGATVAFRGAVSDDGTVSGHGRSTITRYSSFEDGGPFPITGRWPALELNLKRGCGDPKVVLQTG
jgi:hypothetical protein